MKKGIVHDFLGELHFKHLQPLGFKKENRSFVRNKGTYIERFYFKSRGDLWHGLNVHLYVGVEFSEIPKTGLPQQTILPSERPYIKPHHFPCAHWVALSESIASDTNYHGCATFKLYSATRYSDLVIDLAAYIPFVSDQLETEITNIQQEYTQFLQAQTDN